jgi:hypothetical protein
MAQSIGNPGPAPVHPGGKSFPSLSREALSDLKTELGELKEALTLPEGLGDREYKEILERLAALPNVGRELEQGPSALENLGREGVGKLVENLRRGVEAGLDRRSLMETKDFLLLLLNEMERTGRGKRWQGLRQAPRDSSPSPGKDMSSGSIPGDQPGAKAREGRPSPAQARAVTHLKGLLGKGKSTGLTFRGEPRAEDSEIAQEDIITSYKRQVEEELATEQIPGELKETIKNYFLSLGMAEGK